MTATQREPEINDDAYGEPAVFDRCYRCGEGFTEDDLRRVEWVDGQPVHYWCAGDGE